MQEEGQKAQVQVPKLALDGLNWAIYCNRLKWALQTNSLTDHSSADSPLADYLALGNISSVGPEACWAKEKPVIKQVLGLTLPNTAFNRIEDMLQSITMPAQNFFHQLSLAPTHSYSFLYHSHKTSIPFSDPSTSMLLNCTVLIPVQWITCSLSPHHSSHITFIKDSNNTQDTLMCPTLQMYLYDRPHIGCKTPEGLYGLT
jgi:hypothetical protein